MAIHALIAELAKTMVTAHGSKAVSWLIPYFRDAIINRDKAALIFLRRLKAKVRKGLADK
jgi:hypothetical protein